MDSTLGRAADGEADAGGASRGRHAAGALVRPALLLGLLAGLLSACADDALPPLARGDGRSAAADAGPRVADGRASDVRVGAVDRGVDAHVTVTDAWPCLQTADLAGWVLADDYCVVAQTTQRAAAAWGFAREALWSFGPRNDQLGSLPLRRWAWRAGVEPSALEEVAVVAPGVDATALVFPGSYLALAGTGAALVGYTLADGDGSVVMMGPNTKLAVQVNAPGNFDAAWLDDETLLVNGMGLEGSEAKQALYAKRGTNSAARLVKDLGAASSYVAVGRSVVYVGGAFGAFPSLVNRVFAFDRDRLSEALSDRRELDGDDEGVEVYQGDLGDLTTVGDELVWLDSYYDEKRAAMAARGVFRRGVQRLADRLAPVGTPSAVLTPGTSTVAQPVGLAGDGVRLLVVLDRGAAGHALLLLRPR
ncbi:MAG: hypothetical protein IPG96_12470 [Proteobacteria bacterium]|nr:hypothetical protein [Pseudomonadota bacterium]